MVRWRTFLSSRLSVLKEKRLKLWQLDDRKGHTDSSSLPSRAAARRCVLVLGGARSKQKPLCAATGRTGGSRASSSPPPKQATRRWPRRSPAIAPSAAKDGRRLRRRAISMARSKRARGSVALVGVSRSGSPISPTLGTTLRRRSSVFATLLSALLPDQSSLYRTRSGSGIVPETPLGRRLPRLAGRLNQRMAAACDAVVFIAAGLPIALKPAAPPRVALR